MHWPPRKGDEHRTQACGARGSCRRSSKAAENRRRTACGSRRKAFSALLVNSISCAANDPSSEVGFFLDFGPGPPGFSLQSSQMLSEEFLRRVGVKKVVEELVITDA